MLRHVPYQVEDDRVLIRVRVTPKSSRDAIEGDCDTPEGRAFAARVTAPPSDGAANAAIERLIADWLDLAKSRVSLFAGHKSRIKIVTALGDGRTLGARIVGHLTSVQNQKTTR